jgi:predicted ATPase/DNA-binding XRE family transcriptional regulator
MVETKSFGQWLRHRRRELDLTQEELAHQVGCAPITIRKIEAEEMRPSKQLAELLGKALGVPAEEREGFVRFARGGVPVEPVTVAAPKQNLHHPVSSFIGREREIADVRVLLSTTRLVTLTGAGGCGKTRLALETARQALDEFPDGVWLVSLASLSEPMLVVQTIASTLGVREVPPHPVLEALSGYLRSRSLLLILDNCEHLVEACAQAADPLLQSCPQLHILATSREALEIQGEAQYYVPSLSLPEDGKSPSPESVGRSDAVRLFADRAAAAQAGFSLNLANSTTVAQICRRLDGMPLAIELAAAQIKLMTPRRILAGLDDRFDLLISGNRTAPPRHQTLRAAIDWSYDLLPTGPQRVLRYLSVFSGGFERQAAATVCSGDAFPLPTALAALSNLVDRSLVEVLPAGEDVRYQLLETIRMYAGKKLQESGEESQLRDRHLEYFREWAEQVEPELRGLDMRAWCDRMEVEHDNIRAALQWALRGGHAGAGLRLAGSAAWYWQERCYWKEGLQVLKELLAGTPSKDQNPARAKALVAAGTLALLLATPDPAEPWFDEALRIWRGVGDSWWIAYTLHVWGWYNLYKNDAVVGRARFEEAVAIARSSGDPWILGTALKGLGAAIQRLDYAAARPILAESISIWRRLGNREGLADALNQLGTLAHGEHDEQEAVTLFEESLAIFRNTRSTANIVMVLCMLGFAVQCRGDNERAGRLLAEALALARDSGYDHEMAASLAGLGGVAAAQRKPKRGARLLGAAAAWRESVGEDVAAWPYVVPDYDRWAADARAQLTDQAFAEASAEGQAMTLERAAQYALEAGREEEAD